MRLLSLAFCLLLSCCLAAQVEPQSEGVTSTIPSAPPSTNSIGFGRCSPTLNTDEPLYIIDGYPAEKVDLNGIDPASIESINVIKDESALLIYGSRAANGVIIIQTKRGFSPRPDYTLIPEEIPADLFSLYETLDFGAGKEVVYLLNGKRTKLRKIKKISTAEIAWIKVYQQALKVRLMGYNEQETVVDVILR